MIETISNHIGFIISLLTFLGLGTYFMRKQDKAIEEQQKKTQALQDELERRKINEKINDALLSELVKRNNERREE